MALAEQKAKVIRQLRTQRTQSDHDHGQIKPSPELWITSVLKDEQESRNVLKTYGIDRISLKTAGIVQADRIYNSLFIYSQGVYNSLEELTSQSFDKKSIMIKLWKVFSLLTNKCKPKIIDEDQIECQKQISLNIINEQFQSLIQMKEQDLAELQEQIRLRDEAIKILEQKLKLQNQELVQYNDLIEERDKLFSQETKKRVNFETKINKIQLVFNENLHIIELLNQRLLDQEKQLKNYESELESKRDGIINLNVMIQEQEQRIESLKCRAFDAEIQARLTKELNQQLEQKYQDSEVKKQRDYAQIQQLNYSLQISQSQQTKLEIINKQQFNNLENFQERQHELQNEISNNCKQIYDLNQQMRKQEMQTKLLLQENSVYQVKFVEMSQNIEINSKKLIELEQENFELKKKQVIQENEYDKMSNRLKIQTTNYEECLFTYKELKHEYDFEQSTRIQLEIDYKRLQDQLKQIDQEKRHSVEQMKDLQKKTMFQLSQHDDKSRALYQIINKKDEIVEELTNNNKLLNYNTTQLESQITSLTLNLQDLQNKYSTEIIKRQDVEQQLKLLRQEIKNLQTEFKRNEENLMGYSIKYNQIKEYPNMYSEINEQYIIAQKLVEQLHQDIAMLKRTKSCSHNFSQTEMKQTIDTEVQYQPNCKDIEQQTELQMHEREAQTEIINWQTVEIQTELLFQSNLDQRSLEEKLTTQRQHQFTQVDLITQADYGIDSQKMSIEHDFSQNGNQQSQQQSQNIEESCQTRLLPQYCDNNSARDQKRYLFKKNNDLNVDDSGEFYKNQTCANNYNNGNTTKGRAKPSKGLELPQISNNIEKSQVYNSKTPSTRFAKMYIQASEYYKK